MTVDRPIASGRGRSSVDRDDVINAAIEVLDRDGFRGRPMRALAAHLGVSPIPLYTKVGDKRALIEAVAERLLGAIDVDVQEGTSWPEQAELWAHAYRDRLKTIPERNLLLDNQSREVQARCTRPLFLRLRGAGLTREEAVRVCRMLMWATNGFVIVESGVDKLGAHFEPPDPEAPLAGQAEGVTQFDIDDLFATQIRFLVDGLRQEVRRRGTLGDESGGQ